MSRKQTQAMERLDAELSQYSDYLPDELRLDETHPANASYMQGIDDVRRRIMRLVEGMPPIRVRICRAHQQGTKKAEIAEAFGVSGNVVARHLKSPDALQLLALLQHLTISMDGVSTAHRRQFIWELAVKNKDKDPRVALAAVAELNKMEHNTRQLDLVEDGKGGPSGPVEIVINTNTLPRTELDG